jgi:GTP cyclohydrolase III
MIAHIHTIFQNGKPASFITLYKDVQKLATDKDGYSFKFACDSLVVTEATLDYLTDIALEEKLHERYSKKTLAEDIG